MAVHVVLDLLHIHTPLYTGIASMAFNLVKGFHKYSEWKVSLLVWASVSEFVADATGGVAPQIALSDHLYGMSRLKRGLCPASVKDILVKNNVDVILTTCFTIESFVYPRCFRQIGVVHDMQPFKNEFDEKHYKVAFSWLLQSVFYYCIVPHLVTISNFVRNDVKKYCLRDPKVIYNCISEHTKGELPIKEVECKSYILDVNSFWKYKNTERLILAYCAIKEKIPHYLYLKGINDSQERYQDLLRLINERGVKDRVIIDVSSRTQEEMNYLYHHASLFISPSLREGFGQTPIEASLHQVPVVVSDIDTLQEVTAGMVGTFDPLSVESISNAMLNALKKQPSVIELEHIAARYRSMYSSKRQIEQYKHLIESVIWNRMA